MTRSETFSPKGGSGGESVAQLEKTRNGHWRLWPFRKENGMPHPTNPRAARELIVIAGIGVGTFIFSAWLDTREFLTAFLAKYEFLEIDEILVTTFVLSLFLLVFHARRLRETEILMEQLRKRNEELETAALEIRRLQGILPICSGCKKIRDDAGYWHQVEIYIRDRSDVQFSHGICPQCAEILYPEFYSKKRSNKV